MQTMQKRSIRLYWLLGAMLTVALFFVLYRVSNFRYENSDDGLIMKAFMGFEGGKPVQFSLYTHTLLAWVLYGLSTVAPGYAWFSVFQFILLLASGTVLVKSMMQLAQGYRFPWLAGGIAGGLFLAVFMAFAACRISYTTTAALAGAAAVAQFMTVGTGRTEDAPVVRAYLLSLLLLLCAYSLRAVSVLPSLAFIVPGFVWQIGFRTRRTGSAAIRLRPMLISMLVFILAFVAMIGIRQLEVRTLDQQPTLDWQNARITLMDYTSFEANPAPALAANSGLPAAEVEMVRQWYFMDSNITTQALQSMAGAYTTGGGTNIWTSVTTFFTANPRYVYTILLLMALCALCLLGERKAAPYGGLVALLSLLGGGAMIVLLCLRGRVLPRAVDAAMLPCAAMLFSLALLRHVPFGGRWALRRVATIILAGILLASAGLNVKQTYHDITRALDSVSQQREADLETYALANPTVLVVRSPNLLRDTRLLPDVNAGIPANIVIWGDWNCRLPGWYAQLAKLGFDGHAFAAKDWLRDTLVFAAAASGDMQALQAYLTEALGAPVEAVPYGSQGTLSFYRFQSPL